MPMLFYSGQYFRLEKLKKRGEGDQGSSKKIFRVKEWAT